MSEPHVLGKPSILNYKYTYRQIVDDSRKLVRDLFRHSAYYMLAVMADLPKSKRVCHLLELNFLIDSETMTPWLYSINSGASINKTGVVFNDALSL